MTRRELEPKLNSDMLSRRDLLRVGGLLVPAAALAPTMFARVAFAQTATFDYYISPSGSDSNPGTEGSPWAITAINTKRSIYTGKRVGLMNGTYNVGSLMSTTRDAPALNIDGGTAGSPTFIGAISARQAIITANNGSFGGGTGNKSAMLAHDKTMPHQGHVTIDGLSLRGCSLFCLEFGNYDFTNNLIPGLIVQNCEFTANNAANSPVASGVNVCVLTLFKTNGLVVNNCYFHDNAGWSDASHFSACYQWQCQNNTFQYCTLINTAGLHGKESANQGTTIQYCYIDVTSVPSGQNASGIQGFDGAPTSGLTLPSSFHHNIIIYNYAALDLQSELGNGGWSTPLRVYNNTFVAMSGWAIGIDYFEAGAGGLLTFYNNLFFDNGHASSGGYGYSLTNRDAFALIDYNVYGGHALWNTVGNGQHSSAGANSYTSLAAWQAAISGDAHSQNGVVTFANAGALALQYQVKNGLAYQAGRVGGKSSGEIVNAGAWDGSVTQIGSSSGSVAIPDPPILSVS